MLVIALGCSAFMAHNPINTRFNCRLHCQYMLESISPFFFFLCKVSDRFRTCIFCKNPEQSDEPDADQSVTDPSDIDCPAKAKE